MKTPRLRTWWSDRIIAMRRDRRSTTLQGVAYLLAISWLDYATGYEINLSVVYLTPLIMLTVAGGWRLGLITVFACASSIELTDWLAGRRFDHFTYHFYSFVSHSLSYLSFLLLITQLLKLWDQERLIAGQDPLTGLSNRYGFLTQAEETLRACAKGRRAARLSIWNVARLRQVNASHGHDKADALLLSVADALREALPEALLARFGADKFVVLEDGCTAQDAPVDQMKIRGVLDSAAAEVGVPIDPRRAARELTPLHRTPEELAGLVDALLDEVREGGGGG